LISPQQKADLEAMKSQVSTAENEVGKLEDAMFTDVGPKGKYSAKSFNAVIDAANKLGVIFGIEDGMPRVKEDQTQFPPDFVRLLAMFADAIDDGIEEGALPEEVSIAGLRPVDDPGLTVLASKLTMAGKSKDFKRFLAKPKKYEEEKGSPIAAEEMGSDENEMAPESMTPDQMDSMFAARMR